MMVDTVAEAKAQLDALIEKVRTGEKIIIKTDGKPVAILQAYDPSKGSRKPGALRGQIHIEESFDELPSDIAETFGMKTH